MLIEVAVQNYNSSKQLCRFLTSLEQQLEAPDLIITIACMRTDDTLNIINYFTKNTNLTVYPRLYSDLEKFKDEDNYRYRVEENTKADYVLYANTECCFHPYHFKILKDQLGDNFDIRQFKL